MKKYVWKLIVMIGLLFATGVAKAENFEKVVDVPKNQILPIDSFVPFMTYPVMDPRLENVEGSGAVIRFHIDDTVKTIELPETYVEGTLWFGISHKWSVDGRKLRYIGGRGGPVDINYRTKEDGVVKGWNFVGNVDYYGEVSLDGQVLKPHYAQTEPNLIEIRTDADLSKVLTVSQGLTNWWYVNGTGKGHPDYDFFPEVSGGGMNVYHQTLGELFEVVRRKVPGFAGEVTFEIEMSDGSGLEVEGVPAFEGMAAGRSIVYITLRDLRTAEPTAILSVTTPSDTDTRYISIDGRVYTDYQYLPKGIYIHQGKKMIKN